MHWAQVAATLAGAACALLIAVLIAYWRARRYLRHLARHRRAPHKNGATSDAPDE